MTRGETVALRRGARRLIRIGPSSQVLIILCLMYLVMYIERVNIATAAPFMTADLGLSNTQFGLAISAFSYPYALFQLIGGWVSDRFGPRRALILSGLVVCAATACTGLVGGLGSLIAARVVLGFGEGSAFPTATRAMSVWIPRARWGFAQGITHSASRFGNALTPPLIAGLMAYTSWRGSFMALGLLGLTWVALWWWVFRDDPRQHERITAQELTDLPPAPSNDSSGNASSVPWLRLARRMLPVTAVDFCYGWTLWVFLTWLPSFFFKSFHLDLKHSALFSSGVLLGGVIGDTVGGILSDWLYRRTGSLRVARSNLIIVGMLGAFCFLIPVVLTHDLTTVAFCLSAACFFSELVVAPIWSVPMDIAPRYAGSASGLMNFGFGLAGIISPVVFGGLLDLTGSWAVPFYGSIGLLLLGACLSFLMRPDETLKEVADAR
jgi:MFS family permease